jgi:hypothetical protein
MNTTMKKTPSYSATIIASILGLSLPLQTSMAQSFVLNKNSGVSTDAALAPLCATNAAGDGDGGVKKPGDPDGGVKKPGDPDGGVKKPGDPDGKNKISLKASALTTSSQPDLAISRVNATLETNRYSLSFCVFNRGGKPAYSPTVLVVQAGDVVLQELTIFDTLPSLRGMCFGSGDRELLPSTAKPAGATIQVTAATGETALLNNKCRIQWDKK